jgi:pimeloyl-ACP methyl ester carboxylesterase
LTATSETPTLTNYPFEDITVPTLGVHAVDDPLASYKDARSMVARIPGSHWVAVERGGHIFIHNDEHALAEIAAFLTSSTAPTAYVNRGPEVGAQRSNEE